MYVSMARSRLATSAVQSVTTSPSTQDTMSSLVSLASGPTTPPRGAALASAYSGLLFSGGVLRLHACTDTTASIVAAIPRTVDVLYLTIQITSSAAAVVTGQKSCVVPESAKRRENVVAYRLLSSSCNRP